MAKCIAAMKFRAGLQQAVICPNVTQRSKDMIAQNKRVRAGSLAIVDKPHMARTCILRAFGSRMSCFYFSGNTFLMFFLCFIFVFFILSLKLRPFVQPFFDMHAARQPHLVTSQLYASFFVSLEMSLFPSFFVPLPFFLCMNSMLYASPPGGCFFTL